MPRLPTYWLLIANDLGASVFEGTRPFRDLRPVDPGRMRDADSLREDFARALADDLERAGRARRFDRLVIAAPSPLIGEIHTFLGASARARLRARAERDLTGVPVSGLPAEILGVLRF